MDVTFDLSILGESWIVAYDPACVHADVAHEEFLFEETCPACEPGGLVEMPLDQYDGTVRFRCTTGELTAHETALVEALRAEDGLPAVPPLPPLRLVSGTVYLEGPHDVEEALGLVVDLLGHVHHPAAQDAPPSARRVRGWLAHFTLPPGVYTLRLHEVCYDLEEAPTPDVPNFVLQFLRQEA